MASRDAQQQTTAVQVGKCFDPLQTLRLFVAGL